MNRIEVNGWFDGGVFMTLLTDAELEYAIERMRELSISGDIENNHIEADQLLVHVLTKIGYTELVELYRKVPKWYA